MGKKQILPRLRQSVASDWLTNNEPSGKYQPMETQTIETKSCRMRQFGPIKMNPQEYINQGIRLIKD